MGHPKEASIQTPEVKRRLPRPCLPSEARPPAANQIKKILKQEAPGSMLRISVQGGGCSGFSYSFSIDDTATVDDKQFTRNNIIVLVDELSLQYMDGAEIDWVDDLIGASFKINNPVATSSCGCGTSFSV